MNNTPSPRSRVFLWTLFSVSALAALVALVPVDADTSSRGGVMALIGRTALVIMTAAALGLAVGALRRREPVAQPLSLAAHEPASAADSRGETVLDEHALLGFARSLLAATSAEAFQNAVEGDLPRLLGGRKVWIAWHHAPRASTQDPGAPKPSRSAMLTDAVQEWTTFPLRLDDQRLGLLGVESAGSLSPMVRERIGTIIPLIAQALQSVQAIDLFREASVVDLLTGAATRREGYSRLQMEVKRAQRTRSVMAVLMIDLDHFKVVNDQFGHAVGDALLTAIGGTMMRTLRASDVRCRWGGEEFLVVLPETTLAQAQVVASNLLHHIAATMVPTATGTVSSTASIGLTISRPGETDVNRIVARADMALYRAKHAGRARMRVVLGGFDGEPIGADEGGARAEGRQGADKAAGTLPFPDRRNPLRPDRRRSSHLGRRRTDPHKPANAPAAADRRSLPNDAVGVRVSAANGY